MPHVTIEFSQGLEKSNDFHLVCEQVFATLALQDEFDPPTIKVRATPVSFFRIGSEPQTFVHATLMLMDGRDAATRKRLNQTILEVLDKAMPDVGSITVREVEIDRATYAKRMVRG